MKKLLAVLVLVFIGSYSFGQWSTSGTDIYNNNTGKIYLGDGSLPAPAAPIAKMHMQVAGNASCFLESTSAGATPGAYGQFRLISGNTGHIFNNVLRYYRNSPSHPYNYEMLQSLYKPDGGGKWCEFLYFNFTDQKFEFRNGIEVAEFKNNSDVFFNNGPLGPLDPSAGRVGIGTTGIATGVKLQVGGKVKCQEVEVAVAPWPDHVFKADYNLMSLNEVEAFINANKHLPGVPSEAEVAENGVNVGEMNATLLQKIEELTLYMINLKKENDALNARISNLEK